MKQKHRHYGAIVFVIVLIVAFFLLRYLNLDQFTDPEYLRMLLIDAGYWGYFLLVGLLLVAIPLPIPSTPIVLAGGYVYGPIIGTLLALIAVFLGGSIAFYTTRIFGRPVLESLVDEHHITHFNHIFKKRGVTAAFISYALPLFPSDIVHLMLGLTRISYKHFLALNLAGHIPRYLILNSLGGDFFSGFTLSSLWTILGAGIFILIAVFREPLKRLFFKELRALNHEVHWLEKLILRHKEAKPLVPGKKSRKKK